MIPQRKWRRTVLPRQMNDHCCLVSECLRPRIIQIGCLKRASCWPMSRSTTHEHTHHQTRLGMPWSSSNHLNCCSPRKTSLAWLLVQLNGFTTQQVRVPTSSKQRSSSPAALHVSTTGAPSEVSEEQGQVRPRSALEDSLPMELQKRPNQVVGMTWNDVGRSCLGRTLIVMICDDSKF